MMTLGMYGICDENFADFVCVPTVDVKLGMSV